MTGSGLNARALPALISSKSDEAMGTISVKSRRPSRKGEIRTAPRTKESQNRYAGSRQKEKNQEHGKKES